MTAGAPDGVGGNAGLAPAFAAARARLGLVALLFVLAGASWWWTADQMRGMDAGPWTGLGTLGGTADKFPGYWKYSPIGYGPFQMSVQVTPK